MYICQECGHEFTDPSVHPEHRYRGREIVETLHIHVCPRCYCPQYDEAIHCAKCGTPIHPTEKHHLCHDCRIQAEQRFVELLHDNFNEEEIEHLNDVYEGRYFEIK